MKIKPSELDSLMSADHMIYVGKNGEVTEPRGVYPPDVLFTLDEDGQITFSEEESVLEGIRESGWSVLRGYTQQHGYCGALFHQSEHIGESMATHILNEPGYYVVIIPNVEQDGEEPEPENWMLLWRSE